MKRHVLVGMAVLISLLYPVAAVAQAGGAPLHSLELDIYNLASGVYSSLASTDPLQQDYYPLWITYQSVLSDHLALGLVVGTQIGTATAELGASYSISPGVGLDWHPFDIGLSGFYCGPFVGGAYSIRDMGSPVGTPATISGSLIAGAILGYQLPLPLSFVIDIATEGYAEVGVIGWSGIGVSGSLQVNVGVQF